MKNFSAATGGEGVRAFGTAPYGYDVKAEALVVPVSQVKSAEAGCLRLGG
jgi:hypothetical protein